MPDAGVTLVERFRRARHDPGLAVIEGFHGVKHALRFGAELLSVQSPDPRTPLALADRLAPDVRPRIEERVEVVPAACFERLAPSPPRTGLIAIARRPAPVALPSLLRTDRRAPLVLLHDPADHANVGAVIRVAAGAGAGAVLTTGEIDPWHPTALRGSAGLHYALPVLRIPELPTIDRPIVAADPDGEELRAGDVPDGCAIVFGSERHGLGDELLERASRRVRIPMEGRVSSLNLATSVAVMLYSWRCGPRSGGPS